MKSNAENFARFADKRPQTRIQFHESVLGGTDEALVERRMHLGIDTSVPPGLVGDTLMQLRVIAAAPPDHALRRFGRPPTYRDLRAHRQLVVRDSGLTMTRAGGGWCGAEQRWTVSDKATSIFAAGMGLGFAWFREATIRGELERGALKPLPLSEGVERHATVYPIVADGDVAGPGTRRIAQLVREEMDATCAARGAALPRPPAEAPARARARRGNARDAHASLEFRPRCLTLSATYLVHCRRSRT